MGFGVFIHRADSIYNDSPAEQYQFPPIYLDRAKASVGNWIVYYEPTKIADTRGYFAVAKVQDVIADPSSQGMYLALIEPDTYLDFATAVPFRNAEGLIERGLLNKKGGISGRAQSAVRSLSPDDFKRIVELGLQESAPLLPRSGEAISVQEEQSPFVFDAVRDRAKFSVSRIVRDRVFRRVVLQAYDQRCAITGLRLINGRGRAEVDAAHIRPVENNGPDIVSNGIALSGTAHWMFDRGLIGLTDDLEILISRQANDQDAIRGLINKSGFAFAPGRMADRPHPHFLNWHRTYCFKK
jgi:putative restriction endonuclease